MSLYYVQKFLYELNRDEGLQARYTEDRRAVLAPYELTDEEIAALVQIPWQDYLQRMRDGIEAHGPVREGVYAMTGYEGTEEHAQRLGQQRVGQEELGQK